MLFEVLPNIWISFEPIQKEQLLTNIELIIHTTNNIELVNIDSIFEEEHNFSPANKSIRSTQIKKWRYHLEKYYTYYKSWKKIFIYSTINSDWCYYYLISWIMWNGSLSKENTKKLLKKKMESYYDHYQFNYPSISTFWDDIFIHFDVE
jgi:hypothetical protein